MGYKVFKPTQEMLDELNKRIVYKNPIELDQSIHEQQMLLIYNSWDPNLEDRFIFSRYYKNLLLDLSMYYNLVKYNIELWLKNKIVEYLNSTEDSYGIDIPINDYMCPDLDVDYELSELHKRYFEIVMIQKLRGSISYDDNNEIWYEKYNQLSEHIYYLEEEYTKLAHSSLIQEFNKYIIEE